MEILTAATNEECGLWRIFSRVKSKAGFSSVWFFTQIGFSHLIYHFRFRTSRGIDYSGKAYPRGWGVAYTPPSNLTLKIQKVSFSNYEFFIIWLIFDSKINNQKLRFCVQKRKTYFNSSNSLMATVIFGQQRSIFRLFLRVFAISPWNLFPITQPKGVNTL